MKHLRLLLWLPAAALLFACGQETYPPIVETPTYTYRPGQFVWHELGTTDLDASKRFYGELFGWEFDDTDLGGAMYSLITQGGKNIGGMIYSPGTSKSGWVGAISVEDTKSSADFLSSNGAKSLIGSSQLPGRGSMALMQDSQDAMIALVHSNIGDPELQEPMTYGWLWMELWSENPEDAAAFYSRIFGYDVEEREVEGKPYWLFSKNEVPVGGISRNPVKNMKSQWVPYIKVSDPVRMADRARELGANILLSPSSNIRQGSVAIIADPNGAIFCMQKWPIN